VSALLSPLRRTGDPATGGRLAAPGKRRSVPYAVLGVVLVAACALGFLVTSVSLGARSAVLALSTTVKAGQVITAGDLRSVQVAAGAGVAVIPATEQATVLGRTAAVTLTAGSLLTTGELGTSTVPGAGQAMVSVLVKFGAYPADLAPGARVAVATGATTTTSGNNASAAGTVPLSGDPQATVLAVTASSTADGSAAVELQADTASAGLIAAIPSGQTQLITIAAGGA
jgi:hypothetical protein